ncbi:helix-turn-helix transcriptional regulator [Cellulosilyticum sp. WCF-2]|nr:helix-turn-helix transcriptional regulator [Cellulosilyticum sp. WCF-2]
MTQKQVAEKLEISISTYNTYENGTRNIPLRIAENISKLFDVNLNEIFLPVTFTICKSDIA